MNTKLFWIRKIKALFSKFKLHGIFRHFESFILNLLYMSKLSTWISKQKELPFNDFYNSKVEYNDRFNLHKFVIENYLNDEPIDYLEFGVAEGTAIKWWVGKIKNIESRFFGFDVFTGLPEDFGVMKKHHYDTEGKTPDIEDSRVQFISGLFQKSLPTFLKTYRSSNRKVIHMDADLYSSTLFVLTNLYPLLNKDDILIFDEFGVPTHEFKAFLDFTSSFEIKLTPLGAVNNYLQVAFRVE